MTAANLAIPLRTALINKAAITSVLPAYFGSYPIFTRRPAPVDAPYPMIMISPDIAITDNDGIDDYRPVQTRDIIVYGQNDTAAKYHVVEDLAFTIRSMFHSTRLSITVTGWQVVLIDCRGPIPAPTDDDQTIARMVTLTVQLARKLVGSDAL